MLKNPVPGTKSLIAIENQGESAPYIMSNSDLLCVERWGFGTRNLAHGTRNAAIYPVGSIKPKDSGAKQRNEGYLNRVDKDFNSNPQPLGELMQLNLLLWQKTALTKAQSCAKRPKHF
jgi:hypothetical protein